MGHRGEQAAKEWLTPEFARVLDMMRDAVVLIDTDDVIRYVNPPVMERLGSTRAELEGTNLFDLIAGMDDLRLADHLGTVRRGGEPVELLEWVAGLNGWFRVDVRPADPFVALMVRDITTSRVSERRATLETLIDETVEPAASFADALRATTSAIREWLGFEVGEGWMVDVGGNHAHLVFVDHALDDEALGGFADVTRTLDVDAVIAQTRQSPAGLSMSAGGTVTTMPELADEPSFNRATAATTAGLTAAVHVGLDLGGGRSAVIGLLRRRRLDIDDSVVLLQQLRTHLVAVLSRHVSLLDLEQFFELTREYICVTTIDGTIRRANPALVRGLGFQLDDLLGSNVEVLVHPDDRQRTQIVFADLVSDGIPLERFENRIRGSDGRYRWVSWTSHALVDQGVFYSSGRDVTIDRALRILREGQNEVMRGILAGGSLSSSMDRMLSVLENVDGDALGTVIAYDEQTNSISVVAGPSLPEEYLASLDGALAGPAAGSCGTAIHEAREVIVEDIANDPLWVEYRDDALAAGLAACWSLPIVGNDDRILGALAVYSRVPRRPSPMHLQLLRDTMQLAAIAMQAHRTSRELVEGEERFRRLAEVATDAILDWDIITGSHWRSEGLPEMFGDLPADDHGAVEQWLRDRIHPDDVDEVLASRNRAFNDGSDRWLSEPRVRRVDGTYAEVSLRAVILRDADGRAVRMIAGIRDMTERKALERQFLRAQRVESLGTIAGGIAHDLNNSLAPILMAVDLLQTADLDEEYDDVVDTIGKSARRSAEMVRKILSYARGIDGQRDALSVIDLVGEAIHLVRDPLPKNIEIQIRTSNEATVGELWVFGDATQLHQVLVNLLLNARDAMPDGGNLTVGIDEVTVGLNSALQTATVDLPPGPYVRIGVTDTGIGMSPNVVSRLFEPFFTTKPDSEGTGLGLPTSLAIARAHGGDLAVATEVGRGSTVSLVVPIVRRGERRAAQTAETGLTFSRVDDRLRGDGAVVLVVDDEPSIRSILSDTLQSAGYRVIEASDGREALDRFHDEAVRVDIVLTDIMMPGMDGVELAARLRAVERRVPVVAMTGLDDSVRASNLAESGVATVIPKPFDRATVLSALWAVRDDAG